MLEYLCTKFCRPASNGSAAVARRSRGSNGVNCEVLNDGGSDLTMETAADGPLECPLSGRDELSRGNTPVGAPEDVDMRKEVCK